MSQIFAASASGPPTPVNVTFVTDVNSPAVTIADVLDVFGGSTSVGTAAGIQTDGSSGSNVLTIKLTNRVVGTVTTANNTPTTIATLGLAGTPAVYNFDMNFVAFNTTDTLGAGWKVLATVRSDGTNTFIVGIDIPFDNTEPGMQGVVISISPGGVGVNTAVFQVTGLTGKTIDWQMVGLYVAVA